jgi:hypothetical protein
MELESSASPGTHDGRPGSTRGRRAVPEPESPSASPKFGGRKVRQKHQHTAEDEPGQEHEAVPKKLNMAEKETTRKPPPLPPPLPPEVGRSEPCSRHISKLVVARWIVHVS